jgi:leader peptidase (prepilin peptidase)/N-methyltransferase
MSAGGASAVPIDVLSDATVAAMLCLLAANVGSFLNVVAYRVPRGLSVARGGSRCPACGNPVRWRDNVPVIGWLALRGRCRDCGVEIASRYALVEAAAGAIGAIAAAELLSGGRTWPAGRFGIGRTGVDVLVMEGDWRLALVCAAHAALLLTLLLWALFEADRTRLTWGLLLGVMAALGAFTVVAGGPTVAAGWPAAAQAIAGAAAGFLLGTVVASPWLRQGLVFVGTVLGWQAVLTVGAIMAAVAVGRVGIDWFQGKRCRLEPTGVDLLAAAAVQVLAWRWIAAAATGAG